MLARRKQPNPKRKPGGDYAFTKEAQILKEWMDQRLSLGDVPRLGDVVEHARVSKIYIPKKNIAAMFKLHEAYLLNRRQQRDPGRSRKQAPIVTNTLGCLHGDIGYFSLSTEYSIPKTYRHGYMLFRDVLSRYTYVDLLKGEKTQENLVRSMKRMLLHHKMVHPDYDIVSIGFDQETSMRSKLVRNFMKEENIDLYFMEHSASKAKIAEGGIRLLKSDLAVLRRSDEKKLPWQILEQAVYNLNRKPIVIENRNTGFRPCDINTSNVAKFIKKVQSIVPSIYFSQFRLDPSFAQFKYKVGDRVRTKLVLSSAQVLGNKRSETSLDTKTLFEIKEYVPIVTRDLHIRPAYRCVEVNYGDLHMFDEEDIALVEPAGREGAEKDV